jgi:hypothetical protein
VGRRQARNLRRGGEQVSDIAEILKVSESTVRRAARGRRGVTAARRNVRDLDLGIHVSRWTVQPGLEDLELTALDGTVRLRTVGTAPPQPRSPPDPPSAR